MTGRGRSGVCSDNPQFVLQANMNLLDVGFKEGWYWQRGALEVISDAANGRIHGTKRWNVKGNAPDRETAVRRAMDQADSILKQELGAAIIGMMNAK